MRKEDAKEKMCPLVTNPVHDARCIGGACMWWTWRHGDSLDEGDCAICVLARAANDTWNSL